MLYIILNPTVYQWDFKSYYYGALAHAAGLNPYDIRTLVMVSKDMNIHYFVYPPFVLAIFLPFTLVNFTTAFYIFIFFKCILLLGLVYLWMKEFLSPLPDNLFLFFCLVAFNSAIFWDLRTGNISILEQFLLWIAFYLFLKDKLFLFCLFIVMSCVFKITPAFFLLLLWFTKDKYRWDYFGGTCLCLAGLFLISYVLFPELYQGFSNNVKAVKESFEGGRINPSTPSLIMDIWIFININRIKTGMSIPLNYLQAVYVFVVITILAITIRFFLKSFLKYENHKDYKKVLVFFMCLTYALILPRFKPYSYILLIVPTYYLMSKMTSKTVYYAMFIVSLIFSYPSNLFFEQVYSIPDKSSYFLNFIGYIRLACEYLIGYFSLLFAYFVWGFYLWKFPFTEHDNKSIL